MLACFMITDSWILGFIAVLRKRFQLGTEAPFSDLSIVKFSWLCRIARLARVIHLFRFFPEILVLLRSLKIAARAVLMTVSLLVCCVYLMAVTIRLVVKDNGWPEQKWSSVLDTFLLLFIYGLFPDFSHLFKEITSTSYILALVCFVCTVTLSLLFMNMLVGVLVEVVKGGCVAEKERADHGSLWNTLLPMVQHFGYDCNRLTFQHCMRLIDTKSFHNCSRDLGIDIHNIDRFVNMLFPVNI